MRRIRPPALRRNSSTTLGVIEPLEGRVHLAVHAVFLARAGQLIVLGDNLANTIVLSRDAAGAILVNGGAVSVAGGRPTVANTTRISVYGFAGDDQLTLNEANGALPRALLFGGTDDDVLTGGSGNDMVFGLGGNDTLLGKGG